MVELRDWIVVMWDDLAVFRDGYAANRIWGASARQAAVAVRHRSARLRQGHVANRGAVALWRERHIGSREILKIEMVMAAVDSGEFSRPRRSRQSESPFGTRIRSV